MKALLATAYAMRALADALIVQLEEACGVTQVAEPPEPGSCPQCHAGPDDVTIADTLDGAQLRHCRKCEHEWVPP